MRHLHAWNDPRGITPVGQEACADDGRNPRRTLGQSVPLHRVHADFRSGGRCGAPPDNKMRSDPQDYQLIAPGTLHAVVSLLAKEPGAWLPIAGGTDVMVLYAAGKLPARKLVNIWNLPELRRIEVFSDEIRIGAGCTYTELREQEIVGREFPLLARAAAWTGGIANQNRGTIGGNIVNASPAADSLPALLVYEVRIALGSVAPLPLRLIGTEREVKGRGIDSLRVTLAGKVAASEIRPIDDIRSTARYRTEVAKNLVEEFLLRLGTGAQ